MLYGLQENALKQCRTLKKVCNRCFLCIPVLFLNLDLLTSVEMLLKKSNGPFLKTSIREERACIGLHSYTLLYTLRLSLKSSLLKTAPKILVVLRQLHYRALPARIGSITGISLANAKYRYFFYIRYNVRINLEIWYLAYYKRFLFLGIIKGSYFYPGIRRNKKSRFCMNTLHQCYQAVPVLSQLHSSVTSQWSQLEDL